MDTVRQHLRKKTAVTELHVRYGVHANLVYVYRTTAFESYSFSE